MIATFFILFARSPDPRDPSNRVRPTIASNLPSCGTKLSNKRFDGAADSFEYMKMGTGVVTAPERPGCCQVLVSYNCY